jgi:NAD(P)-dependent dehydrogenase (short-subunit alcohol dehydrogenase family)
MTHACLPLLTQSTDSAILFNSDAVGRHGKAYWGAYGTSKAGIENFMQTLADETEANTGLRVNSLDPGPVTTSLRSLAYPAENPAGIASPEDVVSPFLYLMSSASQGVTGQQFER